MPPLRAAVSGAKKVADWLADEGIDVKPFYDDAGPVKAADIFDAVDAYVQLGTVSQLIVYFAGHGSFVGTGEYWMLSQALHNSNEAISVTQCQQFARQCGIPNVVLISDACRSTSASLNIQSLTGYNIFPVVNNRKVMTFLDSFFAVRQGAPAFEVKDSSGKYDGIYTSCFLDAYLNPDAAMIEDVGGVKVVPNKRLENYLLAEVPKRAQISDVQEYPDFERDIDRIYRPRRDRSCGGRRTQTRRKMRWVQRMRRLCSDRAQDQQRAADDPGSDRFQAQSNRGPDQSGFESQNREPG